MNARILEQITVRTAPHWSSQALRALQVGEHADLGATVEGEGGNWIVTRLSDGRTGYLPGDSKVFRMRDVKVAQPRVAIYQQPVMGSPVVMSCKSGKTLSLTGLAGDGNNQWVEVITPTGESGFIMPGTRIKEIAEGFSPDSGRQVATKNITRGGLLCVGALVFSIVSYDVAPSAYGVGQSFLVWGAFLFGGFQFFKGLIQYFRPEE
jgi:hypothetical protein